MAWDKTVSQKDAVKAFLVTEDGKFNLKSSTAKFEAAALKYIASQEAEEGLVNQCLSNLFDYHKGVTLNMDFIKSRTVQLMCDQKAELKDPALFAMLSGRVEAAMHEQTGTAEEPKLYAKKMGKGGGFYRLADAAPAKE